MTVTNIASVTLEPGQTAQLQVDGSTVSLQVTSPDPEPFYIGMEGYAGAETLAIASAYPGLRAMRDYGVKLNGETLPSLTPHGTTLNSQLRDMPASCRPHLSFKQWDEARITGWMDTMPAIGAPDAWPEYDLTYHAEPHGDYPDPWPSTYRTRGARLAQLVRAHRNSARVRYIGPVVTRWWLVESKGDPLQWWHEGANAYGLDVYEDKSVDGGRSWTPEELFGPGLDRLYAALPDDVTILIPEWGRQYKKGSERAQRIAADLDYLRSQHPRVRTACYYNHAGGGVYSFAHDSVEASAFRSRLAEPATH